jgi:hypothetical protein
MRNLRDFWNAADALFVVLLVAFFLALYLLAAYLFAT